VNRAESGRDDLPKTSLDWPVANVRSLLGPATTPVATAVAVPRQVQKNRARFAMNSEAHPVYEFTGFRLDPKRRLLMRTADGTSVTVTAKAFDALVYLVERAGELVSRQVLAKALWPSTIVEENNLTQAISVLRRVLGDGYIATVTGRGYQFVAEVRRVTADHVDPGSAGPPAAARAALPRSRAALVALLGGSVVVVLALSVWLAGRSEDRERDPLQFATFRRLTDFDGAEEHAAISRDGRFVGFVADRDGAWDAWVGLIDSGDFRNLTQGRLLEVRNPATRTVGFSPDGSLVILWTRTPDGAGAGTVDAGWAIPTLGGSVQPYLPGISELDWSADGRRIVYHTSAAGDPLFVTGPGEKTGTQIYIAPEGIHGHFPIWSRDGALIYLVRGVPRDEMDVWRIPATGGSPERLTFHNSRVSFPTLLDERTLLYLATSEDGAGPWVHALDLESGRSRRLNTGGVEYTSIAASADGRRLVATAARTTGSLWRVPIGDEPTGEAAPLAARAPRGFSPRLGAGRIVYRAPKAGGAEDIRQLVDGVETELWSGEGRVVAGAALAPDGSRIAFPVQRGARTQLYVMNADGSRVRLLAEEIDVRGAPAWSPDGRWIAVGAMHSGEPRLFKVPIDGGQPIQLGDDYALDPVWSPTGRFLVYSGPDVGTNFPVKAVNEDGTPRVIPELVLSRGSRRMDFLGADDALVILKGNLSYKEFWAVDLESGAESRLAAVGPGPLVNDFDVSSDGREIVFDRISDASDIVLIELPVE
jgi:Tol biopolymer transport system component/DNA-binding winged helix-turn-helix (wHTH) protein